MESVNFLVSVAAVAIAGLSLWRSWSLQKQQDALAAKQLELANVQLSSRRKADISCQLQRGGKTERVVVTNTGQAVARNVKLELDVPEGRSTPLCSDFKDVFPVKSLPPGHSVSILAALSFDTGTCFTCECSWENDDGTTSEKSVPLTL